MGVTQQRATCRACIEAGDRPMGLSRFLKAGGVLAVALGALLALLVYL
jgi:hypothetical protein